MLHDNRKSFSEFISIMSKRTGIRKDILEKDYYISLFLNEIAEKQSDVKMYFKGGTALYKITDEPRRFSEDIDLTVDVRGLTNSQAKKHLEISSNKFTSLPRLKDDKMSSNNRGSITAVYGYDSVFGANDDSLQRFGKLKVEATSFTVSEPISEYIVTPLLYQYANENERNILKSLNMSPVAIKTVSIERMFADKLLAAEFYLKRNELFDFSKHIYDICVLMNDRRIQQMLNSNSEIIKYLSYKRIEEHQRKGSDLFDKPLKSFSIFSELSEIFTLSPVIESYNKMQNIYVFDSNYKIPLQVIQSSLNNLQSIMYNVNDEEQEFLHSDSFKRIMQEFIPEKQSSISKKTGKFDYDDD